MLGAVQAPAQHAEDPGHVASKQGFRIEPEAGEGFALEEALRIREEGLVAIVPQDEPVDGPVLDAPDEVFPDTAAAIGLGLLVQVDAGAGEGDLRRESGAARDVTVVAEVG